MSLALGTKLGAYEVMERLGAGGMRKVYRTSIRACAAMKVVRHEMPQIGIAS